MFDPSEFRIAAQRLATNANNEALIRICIGRAYYAAHLLAREKVRPHCTQFEPYGGCDDEHSIVEDTLYYLNHKDIANNLNSLHDLRKRADYNLKNYPKSDWNSEIETAFSLCNFIVDSLKEIQ
jgi:hypothetical protein